MAPIPSSVGSSTKRPSKMPGVIATTRVALLNRFSWRTWYPIKSPGWLESCLAMWVQAALAASLRGSTSTTHPSPHRPERQIASGTRVVLPAPVGARSTRFGHARKEDTISGKTESIGREFSASAGAPMVQRARGSRLRCSNRAAKK